MRRLALSLLALLAAGSGGAAAPARLITQSEAAGFVQRLNLVLAQSCGQIRSSSEGERPALLLAARGSSPLPALHRLGRTPEVLAWVQLQAPLDVAATASRLQASCSSGRWVLGGAVEGSTLGVALWSEARPVWMMDGTRREAGVRSALQAINLARVKGGRCGADVMLAAPPLVQDAGLRQVALNYVAAQLLRPTGHRGADGSTPASRAGVLGVQEVLAYGLDDPLKVVQAWLDSPSHCRSLRDPALRRIGLDYQLGGASGAVWGALLAP